MKIEGFLKLFIDGMASEVGSLYYDDDINDDEDVLRLDLEDYPGVVVEVDTLLEYMDIYRIFPYYDYHKDERASADLEDLEREIALYYEQKDFEKAVSTKYNVDIWGDDCWGCPGYDVFVGLKQVKCDISIVKAFVDICSNFWAVNREREFADIRKRRLEDLLSQCWEYSHLNIRERENIDYAPLEDKSVVSYSGKEYVLLKTKLENAAIKKSHYELFLKILEEIEYFSDYRTEIYSEHIRYITCSYVVDVPRVDEIVATKAETLSFDLDLGKLLLFVSGDDLAILAKTFADNNAQTRDIQRMFSPHLYTEGQTDCVHIKNAMNSSFFFKNQNWVLDETKSRKGDRELLNLCRAYGNDSEATSARIAIFDRDGSITLREIEEEGKGFKDWGNRMYSFALPVPKHRESTPSISIEHYYSDEELFREYDIDGVKRRLYMGCEFDSIGRAVQIRKVRKTPNKCGPDSIAILDSEVYDIDSNSDIDYALSKSQFTERICVSKLSSESENAFNGLFLKIMEVLRYDEKRKRNLK